MDIENVPRLFDETMERVFHVSTADYKGEKRRCVLCGPYMEIHDNEKITPDIYIYLPLWTVTLKDTSKHSTLYLNEKELNQRSIKIKSKNHEVIKQWFSKMISAALSVQYNVFETAHFIVIANIGSNGSCKASLDMTSDTIKVSDDSGVIFEVRRTDNIIISTTEDGQERMIIMSHDSKGYFRFKDSLSLKTALVVLNSTPPEPKYEDHIALDDVEVPELNLSLTDLMANVAVSQKDVADSILKRAAVKVNPRLSSVSSVNDIFSSKISQDAAGKVFDETDPDTVITRLKNRFSNIIKAIQIQESNDCASVLEEIITETPKTEMKVHPAELFDLKQFDTLIDTKPLVNVVDPIFTYDEPIIYPHEVISLGSPFPLDLAIERLKSSPHIGKLPRTKPIPPPIDNIISILNSTDWSDRPKSATGILLNELKVEISELQKSLTQVEFSVVEIQIAVRSMRIQTTEDLFSFVARLFQLNLAYSFFVTLETAHALKRHCYNVDALVVAPEFCSSIAPLFDAVVSKANAIRGEIPFAGECAPWVIAADAMNRLRTMRHTDNVETEGEDTGALADIVFPVAYLAGSGKKTSLREIILAAEKDGKMKALEKVEGRTAEERAVSFIVGLCKTDEIIQYLIGIANNYSYNRAIVILTAAELLDANQYVLLNDQSQFLIEVTPYIMRRFQTLL